ncbi:hypothetical protein [Sphingobacterium haloxyli]|uniref:hypothetical protein n=1 Tax=Sphingobacterium haloxyli TaxID=2100533 RepID=UPI0010574DA3|nr:hypothetical protein [Sphingobacterium haloxyli]
MSVATGGQLNGFRFLIKGAVVLFEVVEIVADLHAWVKDLTVAPADPGQYVIAVVVRKVALFPLLELDDNGLFLLLLVMPVDNHIDPFGAKREFILHHNALFAQVLAFEYIGQAEQRIAPRHDFVLRGVVSELQQELLAEYVGQFILDI